MISLDCRMPPRMMLGAAAAVLSVLLVVADCGAAGDDPSPIVPVTLRCREKLAGGSYRVALKNEHWDARQTAIVVCDMWDGHYCRASESRVAEMAPHMNEVISAARKRGVLIIHSPSGCMDKYEGTPQRKLAQSAPKVETKIPLEKWCYIDKSHEGELPIDDSVPCEDSVPRPAVRMFTRQHDALKIEEGDAVTDSVEAYYLLQQRGIKNLIVMGVHTNMCVLGRPFGIRQMVRQGVNVVLMRDMTDSMYNPALKPLVTHFRGTELVIEHIEKHWCPTMVSTDFTGKAPFRFKDDPRPRVAMVIGGKEHDADQSLPNFAHLLRDQERYYVTEHLGRGEGENYRIPGLDALAQADVLLLYLRRRALPREQMQQIKDYLNAGKPLLAFRPTSHGFDVGAANAAVADAASVGKSPTAGKSKLVQWQTFDNEVLGCDYKGHTVPDVGTEVFQARAEVTLLNGKREAARAHPILMGVDPANWHSSSWLYSYGELDKTATVLLSGSAKDKEGKLSPAEPVAWTREYQASSGKTCRVFYTSLGHKDDWQTPAFQKLVVSAVKWAKEN